MHQAHVPNSCPLACEGKLQGILASEGLDNQLQFQNELQPLEFSRPTPEPRQSHTDIQL